MPRNSGTGIYDLPPGIKGVSGQTIVSADYNTFLEDVKQEFNTVRPIVAGGTGASTPEAALAAFNGEVANQVITNYDSDTLYSGSFSSASTASGEPVNGHAFSGIIYRTDANNIVVEARDATDGLKYVRRKTSGTWGSWAAEGGGSITPGTPITVGNTTITPTSGNSSLSINKANGVYPLRASLVYTTNNVKRWEIFTGSNAATSEDGGLLGADLIFNKFADAGTPQITFCEFKRTGSEAWFYGNMHAPNYLALSTTRDGEKVYINVMDLINSLQERIATLEQKLESK